MRDLVAEEVLALEAEVVALSAFLVYLPPLDNRRTPRFAAMTIVAISSEKPQAAGCFVGARSSLESPYEPGTTRRFLTRL